MLQIEVIRVLAEWVRSVTLRYVSISGRRDWTAPARKGTRTDPRAHAQSGHLLTLAWRTLPAVLKLSNITTALLVNNFVLDRGHHYVNITFV